MIIRIVKSSALKPLTMSYPTVSQKEISSLLTSIESSGKGFLSHSQLEMPNRVTSKEIAEEARKALIDQARSLIAALEKPMEALQWMTYAEVRASLQHDD